MARGVVTITELRRHGPGQYVRRVVLHGETLDVALGGEVVASLVPRHRLDALEQLESRAVDRSAGAELDAAHAAAGGDGGS